MTCINIRISARSEHLLWNKLHLSVRKISQTIIMAKLCLHASLFLVKKITSRGLISGMFRRLTLELQSLKKQFLSYLKTIQNNLITTCWLSGERSLPFGLLVRYIVPIPLRERLRTHENFIVDQKKSYFFIITRSSP